MIGRIHRPKDTLSIGVQVFGKSDRFVIESLRALDLEAAVAQQLVQALGREEVPVAREVVVAPIRAAEQAVVESGGVRRLDDWRPNGGPSTACSLPCETCGQGLQHRHAGPRVCARVGS